MAIFKCKMCGGTLEINNETVSICEYCGTKQTVPMANDENLHNLYNRATTLRIKSEFDKAEQIYEKILQVDDKQAEAYWGLILCKFGIEYVEDPKTFKRIPTCHRTSFDSIIADEDYKSAITYADNTQKIIYEQEAIEIDRLQKEILELSQKEAPYDVFICYKETDEKGSRTQDSIIANDIYYQLTNEGFKVFYAAISLEDKLGSAYEPCIFAALNSAKVMLVIGTKPEYFNSVWVKNEWLRYLKIVKRDRSKILIPCYKDMDAYDLPDEFSHLQSQDMSKIGFINDIIRGIKKVIYGNNPPISNKVPSIPTSNNSDYSLLLKRASIAIEDNEWSSAKKFAEQMLNIDPERADAYRIQLFINLRVKNYKQLSLLKHPFNENKNYKKAVRFGDKKLEEISQNQINKLQQIKNAKREKTLKTGKLVLSIASIVLVVTILLTLFFASYNFNAFSNIVTVSAGGYHAIGIKKDGSVVATGINDDGQCNIAEWTDIVAVSAGQYHTVGLKNDGTVIAVGSKYKDKCEVDDWSNITAIAAGIGHTVGLKKDGTVVAVGRNEEGQCDVSEWTDIIDISANANHTVGLKNDGTVVATGWHGEGQCNVSEWTNIIDVEAGLYHTVGLKSDGTVVAVGENNYGQCDVENWTDIIAIASGKHHTLGLKKDGTVVAVGANGNGQCDVEAWTDITSISAGYNHTVGLKKDGAVEAVGANGNGQCNVKRWKNPFEIFK